MRKLNFKYIPEHTNCMNCGSCCGVVPISEKEYTKIYEFCKEKKIKPRKFTSIEDCPFRDHMFKRCTIYEVRPTLCRIFGVVSGMQCINKNTLEMDGYDFLKDDLDKSLMLSIDLFKKLND